MENHYALTQVGIGQLVLDILNKINAEGGPRVLHDLDNQLHWVDLYLESHNQEEARDDAIRVRLSIFKDYDEGGGDFNRIVGNTEASIRLGVGQLYVVCPRCAKAVPTRLRGEIDSISRQTTQAAEHDCRPA